MISLVFVFWLGIAIMAVVGGSRGWAKELLVLFSAVLAIFIIQIFDEFLAGYLDALGGGAGNGFWPRTILFILLTFFGYQTPGTIDRFKAAARKDKLQDSLLGFVIGALNGYFVIGSIWQFLDEAKYPFAFVISPEKAATLGDVATGMGELAAKYLIYMPPAWLGSPAIYFAMVIAFAFVLIVFI